MKKNITIAFVAILAAFALNSCIKETFPMGGSVTAEQVGGSASALDASVKGIPAMMSQGYLIYGYQNSELDMAYPSLMITFAEITGEMYPVGDAGYDHYSYYNRCMYMDDNQFETYVPWRTLYMFIKAANDVIGAVNPETASAAQLGYLGMAYADRAFFYYLLTSMYEPVENKSTDVSKVLGLTVPIVTEKTTEAEAKNNPRAKHADMIAFILGDLDKAETYLTGITSTSVYNTSLAVVYGIRAKVLMFDGKYPEAELYARKAITESECVPLTAAEWEDVNTGFNTANKSWMWATKYAAENMGNLCNFIGWMSGENDWGYAKLTGPGIDKALYDYIPETDFRKRTFINPDKTAYYNYKTCRDAEWIDDKAPEYLSIKFRCKGGNYTDYATGGAVDVPLMRVEEMYYIEAEAKAQQNLADGVEALVNFVKTYRDPEYNFNATSLNAFLQEYVKQKKVEFWGEGIAFHDVKRLKTGVCQDYDGTNAPGEQFLLNYDDIKPNMNFVIPRTEWQNNAALAGWNNPDPSVN